MKLLQQYKGLLVDFDGTLANTEALHKKSIDEFFKEYAKNSGNKFNQTISYIHNKQAVLLSLYLK